jgi:hypothetical protein
MVVPLMVVPYLTSASAASGSFSGNANVLTNNLGIAFAPTFTANEISGSYTVSATANGLRPASFSLTNNSTKTGGFGGVYPSREDANNRKERLEEQELEDLRQLLCLDSSLASSQKTRIPECKE